MTEGPPPPIAPQPPQPEPVDPRPASEVGRQYDSIANARRRLIAYIELAFGGAVALLLVGFIATLMSRSLQTELPSKPQLGLPNVPLEPLPKIEILVPILVSLGAMAAFAITSGRRDLVPVQDLYHSKQEQPAGFTDVARNAVERVIGN